MEVDHERLLWIPTLDHIVLHIDAFLRPLLARCAECVHQTKVKLERLGVADHEDVAAVHDLTELVFFELKKVPLTHFS